MSSEQEDRLLAAIRDAHDDLAVRLDSLRAEVLADRVRVAARLLQFRLSVTKMEGRISALEQTIIVLLARMP